MKHEDDGEETNMLLGKEQKRYQIMKLDSHIPTTDEIPLGALTFGMQKLEKKRGEKRYT